MSVDRQFPYKKAAIAAGLLFFGFLLWYFSTIVVYIIVSLFLSFLGRPFQQLLRKVKVFSWKPGESLIAALTLFFLFSVIVALMYIITPAVINQFASISSYSGSEASEILRHPVKNLETAVNSWLPGAGISFKDIIYEQISPLMSLEMVRNTVGHIAKMTVDISVGLFCVAFITFFFLQNENMFSNWIRSLIPDEYVSQVDRAMDSIYRLQVRYIVGITMESLIKFAFLFLSFWIAGLPADTAAVASLVCALLNVIPYVGPIIGGVVAIILGVLSVPYGDSIGGLVIAMTVALVVFQTIDNVVLQPYIYASSVKAHPLEIFIVIIMAGNLAGVVGMLLAIPTYTILRVLAKEFLGRYKVVRELTTNL